MLLTARLWCQPNDWSTPKAESLGGEIGGGGERLHETNHSVSTTHVNNVIDLWKIASKNAVMDDEICGLCGKPGADKIPHPVRWPNERHPFSEYVHAECEDEAAAEACVALTPRERADFLATLRT
jgi:hypothetical protein